MSLSTDRRRVAHLLIVTPCPDHDDPDTGLVCDEDRGYELRCPLPTDDLEKPCALYVECGCPNTTLDDSCPGSPWTGEHEFLPAGWMGAAARGCWLTDSDDARDALACLGLPVGEYLLDARPDDGSSPRFSVLAEISPSSRREEGGLDE